MRRRESKPFRGIRPINEIVPILYGERDFDAFDDFGDFVESVSYGTSKTCQVRGSNPCRDRPGPPVCRPEGPAANTGVTVEHGAFID
jgi:hypothetical protein